VKWTQRSIKHVLTERYYTWEEARQLAEEDPEIDLSGNGPVYTPAASLEVRTDI
jgi:large subunit ribosomal protein L47